MKCSTCEKEFEPRSKHQKYCNPDCYPNKQSTGYPHYICQSCGFKFQLTFFPLNNLNLLNSLECPKCHSNATK